MQGNWISIAALVIGLGAASATASAIPAVGPMAAALGPDPQESSVLFVGHDRTARNPRMIRRGDRFYYLETREDGTVLAIPAYPLSEGKSADRRRTQSTKKTESAAKAKPETKKETSEESKRAARTEPKRKESGSKQQLAVKPRPKPAIESEPEQEQRPQPDQTAESGSEQEVSGEPDQVAEAGHQISCEAAIGIVSGYGFSSVRTASCSGETYGFLAKRDGADYSIKLSAVDGELTEVRKQDR